MKPYFETHTIGALYLVGVLGWYTMELVQLLLQRKWRKTAHRIGPRSFWPAFWVGAAVVVAMLFAAPKIAPGAAIGLPAVGFAVGMVMLVSGVALRLWAFHALGQYFTFSVKVSPDQPVVTAGPYRLLRHPGYAGGMLATVGIGLMWGNWASAATLVLFTLAFILWRIRIEESALLGSLGDRYRSYASKRNRLVPLIW
jgi:protein-S-isoprenylcysteine O-methyltransferase Ste14